MGKLGCDFGVTALGIHSDDARHTEHALWLIENQAIFDFTD